MPKFVKGKSGNPNGRPTKGNSLTDLMGKRLEEEYTISGETKLVKEWIVERVIASALVGEKWAIEHIYDRIEGKPSQRVEANHSGSIGETRRPEIVFVDSPVVAIPKPSNN